MPRLLPNGLPTWFKLGATARISLGLVSLIVGLVLLLDLVFKLLPNRSAQMLAVREQVAVSLAVQTKTLLSDVQGSRLLAPMLQEVQREAKDVRSLGVRRTGGGLVASTASHAADWRPPAGGLSTLTHVIVPLLDVRGQTWGQLEIQFAPLDPRTLQDWVNQPSVLLIGTLSLLGFVVFYLYLRRVLQHLDPTKAIPDRVRAAFDTLTEGLLVLDPHGQVLLANNAFRKLHPGAQGTLVGKRIDEVKWLVAGIRFEGSEPPWRAALKRAEPILGVPAELQMGDGSTEGQGADGGIRRVMINCAAIRDTGGSARGCLMTLDDVTELDRANTQLRAAMSELETSRDQIQRQNDELTLLANCDPMTGCFNRRAFFARAEPMMEQALKNGTLLACVMTDIDKFKSFNDTYGHAVGDLVIQQVAKILKSSMRAEDVLCRFGGEEFCFVLPGLTLDQVVQIADRIRLRLEREAGPAVDAVPGLRITSSFGVALIGSGDAKTVLQLIERADQGLYAAKEGGRNQVQCIDWKEVEAVEEGA